ncbi:MAG TPA: FtsX-like permease family protein [Sedimentisphaerales bacterium]|nr:FtsX-like permease family protein [Sedimentisphaerales bacterium]
MNRKKTGKEQMKISDYIEQSFSNLRKKKLRTFLTTFGVVIGIGALVSMFSFGKGVQKNVTDSFKEMGLFNYIAVYSASNRSRTEQAHMDPDDQHDQIQNEQVPDSANSPVLDDDFLQEVRKIKGVETAFPEIRFPALIKFREKEQFSIVQVMSADVCQSELMKLRAGKTYVEDAENSLIISDSLLRRMDIKEFENVLGEQIEVSTLAIDSALLNPANMMSIMQGEKLPFSQESYSFTIVGVAERMGMGGFIPVRSDVYMPPGPAEGMKKISLTSIRDFFQPAEKLKGYSAVTIKVASIKYIDAIKEQMEAKGLKTFALIDQLKEIKTAFLFMDMFLAAVAMIGITVASLGIINTMVMSILERYREIGIMKAIGASDRDIKKIFFFESGMIGFLGGIFGLALGWFVSTVINQIANHFLAKQGVPYVNYFSFPLWLCLGAVAFSILVSLAAGLYPALRAARVDPVVALRHD